MPRAGVIPLSKPAQIGGTLPAPAGGAAGNTEGKITLSMGDPRNDSGLRALDGATALHNTPALALLQCGQAEVCRQRDSQLAAGQVKV